MFTSRLVWPLGHRDETKAAPVDRLDKSWIAGVILESPAQFEDCLVEAGHRDCDPAPHGVQELVPGHQETRALRHVSQQLPRLWPQIHCFGPAPQLLLLDVNAERGKLDHTLDPTSIRTPYYRFEGI